MSVESPPAPLLKESAPSQSVEAPARRSRRPGDRLAVLDGLRLVAALAVVLFHYTASNTAVWGTTGPAFPHLSRITSYGWLGVELFFLISGFVICMSAWGRDLGAFFVSRLTRLFPAYLFAVLATTAVVAVLRPNLPRPLLHHVFVNLTMLAGPMGVPLIDNVYWTLFWELHFYLLFGLVVWRGLTYRRVVAFCLLWTVASVIATGAKEPLIHTALDDMFSPFFVAGVALYLVYRFGPNLVLWGIVGISWALGLQRLYVDRGRLSLGEIVVVTGIFVVMSAVAVRWLNWIRGGWLTIAGTLTYPLYLLHLSIGRAVIVRLHNHPRWPVLIGLIAAMLLAAWLVYRLVERPLAPRLKRALASAIAERQPTDMSFAEPRK